MHVRCEENTKRIKLMVFMTKISMDDGDAGDYVDTVWLHLLTDSASTTQIARFMGPTWGPPGSCQPQMGPHVDPMNLDMRALFRMFVPFSDDQFVLLGVSGMTVITHLGIESLTMTQEHHGHFRVRLQLTRSLIHSVTYLTSRRVRFWSPVRIRSLSTK